MVKDFFDAKDPDFYSFPKAKSKDNAEFADVVVWHNRWLFLIEVKSRDSEKATSSIESWATWRITEAVAQIRKAYTRCMRRETIHLHNEFFHVTLDHEGINTNFGLVILAFDDKCKLFPTDAVPDLYKGLFPVHVLTLNDLRSLSEEIDNVPDLFYYLQDRYKYICDHDIPLGIEKEVIALYKLHNNNFPSCAGEVDFASSFFWNKYQKTMAEAIHRREAHNINSFIIDELEECFSDSRKVYSELANRIVLCLGNRISDQAPTGLHRREAP